MVVRSGIEGGGSYRKLIAVFTVESIVAKVARGAE